MFAEAFDGIGEIKIYAQTCFADAAAFVANSFRVAGGDVARDEIAEARITALKVVITLGFRDLVGRSLIAGFERHPDAAIVAQRLAHQSELRLIIAGDRDTSGVDLRKARIGEESPAAVRTPDGCDVRTLGIGREIVDIAVAAGTENDGVGEMDVEFAGD